MKDENIKLEALKNQNKVYWRNFLRDVFTCSLGAYGGPEAQASSFS